MSWFRGLFGRQAANDSYILIEPSALSAAVNRGLGDVLRPEGFEYVAQRRWVRSAMPGLREIVAYEAYKGLTYGPTWGISLDFVPLGRKTLTWKRTPQSAFLDLRLDMLVDDGLVTALRVFEGTSAREDKALMEIEATATKAAHMALESLRPVRSVADVVRLMEQIETRKHSGLGPDNYVQTDIALGLALLAVGRTEDGERRIARFCERFSHDSKVAILKKAQTAALAAAG